MRWGRTSPPLHRTGSWANPTGGGRVSWGRPGSVCPAHELSGRTPFHAAAGRGHPGRRTVMFVHGSLDRGDSFRRVDAPPARARDPDLRPPGLPGLPGGGVVDLGGHIDDLLSIAEDGALRRRGPRRRRRAQPGGQRRDRRRAGVAGGLRRHRCLRAAHALAGLPPRGRSGTPLARPWPTTRPRRPSTSSRAWWVRGRWARLTEEGRAQRRADGPALVADLRSMRRRGPTLRRHRARRARRVRHRRPGLGGAPPPRRRVARRQRPRRGRLRDRECAARRAPVASRTISPRWPASSWRGRETGAADQAGREGVAAGLSLTVLRPPHRVRGASAGATASRRTRHPCPRSSCP